MPVLGKNEKVEQFRKVIVNSQQYLWKQLEYYDLPVTIFYFTMYTFTKATNVIRSQMEFSTQLA